MAGIAIKFTYMLSVVFVLSIFCPTSSLRHHIAPCEVIKPCVCEFPTGEGIDLSGLSSFTLRANLTGNVSVLFQPCHMIANIHNVSECNNTSLCLFNLTTNRGIPLGNMEELKFNSENLAKPVELQFVHAQITSTVDLSCQDSVNETSFSGNKINDNEYHFVLKSPAACIEPLHVHHGRSFISVLFISTLIIGVTYVVAMMIVRYKVGAVGWELLPHHDMCMRVPGLCQAAWNSLSNCCRQQPSYEQI